MSTTTKTTSFTDMQEQVTGVLRRDANAAKQAEARKAAKGLLAKDLVSRDSGELFATLQKCTVEAFAKDGRKLLLNPYHVYKLLYTERYAAVIDPNSERLPEQQFTTALVNALRVSVGILFKAATQKEKAAWLEVLGLELEIGVKQVQLVSSPIPLDNAMFRFLRDKFGMDDDNE